MILVRCDVVRLSPATALRGCTLNEGVLLLTESVDWISQPIPLQMPASTVSDHEISHKSDLMDADEQSDDSDDDLDTRMQHRFQSLRTSTNSSGSNSSVSAAVIAMDR